MTHGEPGDDLASLMAKTMANFKANCRGKKKQQNEATKGKCNSHGKTNTRDDIMMYRLRYGQSDIQNKGCPKPRSVMVTDSRI